MSSRLVLHFLIEENLRKFNFGEILIGKRKMGQMRNQL